MELDNVGSKPVDIQTETDGEGSLEPGVIEESFAGIAFGIVDATVLGPMRSEKIQLEDDGDDSSKVYS